MRQLTAKTFNLGLGAALAGLVLLHHWPLLFGNGAIGWDSYDYSYPLVVYLKDSLAAGVFPLWNPFILAGDAMFSQPAVWAYHPLYWLSLAVPTERTYRAFEVFCVLLPVLQTFGFYKLFEFWRVEKPLAIATATALGLCSIGPLLGQVSVAYGIALCPWLLLAAERLIAAETRRLRVRHMALLGLLGGMAILGSYFGVLIFNFLALVCVLVKRRLANAPWLVAAGIAAVLVASVFLLPAIENRHSWYDSITSDFVSPDLRMRGTALAKEQVVDIVKNEQHLLSVLTGIQSIEPGRPHWVLGIGYLWLLLAIGSLVLLRKSPPVRWLWLGLVVSVSYVMGPRSAVFDFVFEFVPFVRNIRYPVFAFYLVILILALLTIHVVRPICVYLEKHFPLRNHWVGRRAGGWLGLAALVLFIDNAIFFQLGAHFQDEGKNLFVPAEPDRDLSERQRSITLRTGDRKLDSSEQYNFTDRSWVKEKRLIAHGYATSDSPIYWYMKNWSGLAKPVWPVRAVRAYPSEITPPFGNRALEAIGRSVGSLADGEVFSDRTDLATASPSGADECTISDLLVQPNTWSFRVHSRTGCLIAITDKNYPGWKLSEASAAFASLETINWIFKAVRVEAGEHVIDLQFRPASFFRGLWITILSVLALSLLAIFSTKRNLSAP